MKYALVQSQSSTHTLRGYDLFVVISVFRFVIFFFQHFSFIDPHSDADCAVRRVRRRPSIVDVCAQGLKREGTLRKPLATGDLVAVKPSGKKRPLPPSRRWFCMICSRYFFMVRRNGMRFSRSHAICWRDVCRRNLGALQLLDSQAHRDRGLHLPDFLERVHHGLLEILHALATATDDENRDGPL